MFGGGSNSPGSKAESGSTNDKTQSRDSSPERADAVDIKNPDQTASGEKRSGNGSPPGRNNGTAPLKKRRSGGMGSKAAGLLASAKNTLSFSQTSRSNSELSAQTPLQKLGKQDPALAVPQGEHNNSAGDSIPGPRPTFRVGVWEDRNKKCRRTMEDTHAFLYNFLDTPAPVASAIDKGTVTKGGDSDFTAKEMVETDNGYFAIFDGHAGTFAADWCGKKLHIILEEIIRKHPTTPIPELLDRTFTSADAQLEKLPVKNSGCTAAIAVLRWEDRVPSDRSATGSHSIAPAAVAALKARPEDNAQAKKGDEKSTITNLSSSTEDASNAEPAHVKLKEAASRQRVLYTANVGDARIVLCRSGKALRLSYDHKGSDENEGRRIANAGGLILNNRVNGVLAVTRALGDTYMKDLVTGHPYTTETVIQPDSDEFLIIACDGIWDVCSDQEAVDLIRGIQAPVLAAKLLVDHALSRFSTDNLSCMVVRFDKDAILRNQIDREVGVEPDNAPLRISEADKIVNDAKKKIADGIVEPVGVSATNSGRGHDPAPINEGDYSPTNLDGPVEEEPHAVPSNTSSEAIPRNEKLETEMAPQDSTAAEAREEVRQESVPSIIVPHEKPPAS